MFEERLVQTTLPLWDEDRDTRELLRSDWKATRDDYKPPVLIPKRTGGFREILEPKPYLKTLQKNIVSTLAALKYGPSPFAHGFVNKRNRRTNAVPHIGHDHLVKVDIENFFGSVAPNLVMIALNGLDHPDWLDGVVRRACFLDDGLPQGAPTSPFLSNIAVRCMDYRIGALAQKFRRDPMEGNRGYKHPRLEAVAYTRYADDMTFSSNWDGLTQILFPLEKILDDYGFAMKHKKTKVFKAPQRFETCGVIVSKTKVNAKRRDRRYWRGRLHKMSCDIRSGRTPPGFFLRKDGTSGRLGPKRLLQIQGSIAAIADVSQQDKEKLFESFKELKELCVSRESSRCEATSASSSSGRS